MHDSPFFPHALDVEVIVPMKEVVAIITFSISVFLLLMLSIQLAACTNDKSDHILTLEQNLNRNCAFGKVRMSFVAIFFNIISPF